MNRYAQVIGNHPYATASSIAVLAALCFITTLWFGKFPDFSDPQLGFETRGTEVSQRLTTWENLRKASSVGDLAINPDARRLLRTTPASVTISPSPSKNSNKQKRKKFKTTEAPDYTNSPPRSIPLKDRERLKKGPLRYWNENAVSDSDVGRVAWVPPNANSSRSLGATDILAETLEEEDWSSLTRPQTFQDDDIDDSEESANEHSQTNHEHAHVSSDGFFCETLSAAYSRVVVVAQGVNSSLFTLEGLQAMCRLQEDLMNVKEMMDFCQTVRPHQCCPPWSLVNYVAMLRNRSSCHQITEGDVSSTLVSLKECHSQLSVMLKRNKLTNVTAACAEGSALYNMLYYLSDIKFEPAISTPTSTSHLTSAMVFLPIAHSASVMPYYRQLPFNLMHNDIIAVPAIDFGIKGALFDLYLVRGTLLMIGGFSVIILCLWMYTSSIFLTTCSVLAVVMSLLIAYFVYTYVFGIEFFPFMNLLALVLAIGIGADDAFIYCKLWNCVQSDNSNSNGSTSLVAAALRASAPSMCVTSLTTAAALFTNCISPITAINCFSLFAGTAVLVNLLMMLSWLPACVVIADRWCCPLFIPLQWRPALNSKIQNVKEYASAVKGHIDRVVLLCVVRLKYVWVVVLGGLAIGSSVVVLHYPKFRLPDSKTFPLFQSNHPFEQYETKYKNQFWFERDRKGNPWNDDAAHLPLQFVWGVIPSDNGNYLDPSSRGDLKFNPTFDIVAQESQVWLLQFCQELRMQPFYQSTMGPLLSNCFIESFKSFMTRRCKDLSGEDRSPCCEASRFPYTRRVFARCAALAVAYQHATPSYLFQAGDAGPRFAKGNSGEIKAIVIDYDSNYTYSNSFSEMSTFYTSVETWFQNQLASAPPGMRGGWFVSDLGFWDLQVALSEGTEASIALSLAVALIVVFLSTLNVLLSLFTVLTIGAIMFVTVAILVLLDWRLNVLESVAVTTAIGLSVDFSLHYTVHYRQANEDLRQPAVVHALTRMSGPTAMGAVTTGAAGAFMLLSSVLPYIQIGILLVVLMIVSWLYSTVFLMSLLATAGPQHGCGQYSRPSPRAWCRDPNQAKPSVPAMWSDTTLSTSSGVAEVHELEALTRGQKRRKPRAQSPALPEDLEEIPS